MLKLALNFALPAAGIVLAALAQLALTALWPGLTAVPSRIVTIDGYFAVLLTVGLCFIAGFWARRNVATNSGAVCVAIIPLAWLGITLGAAFMGVGPVAWLRPLALFTIFAAMAPLIGVGIGWVTSPQRID